MSDIFEQAAEAWLRETDDLGEALSRNEDVASRARQLQHIIAGGESVLSRIGDAISSHQLASVHLRLTAARVDSAVIATTDADRADHARAALEHVDLAVAAAFAARPFFVQTETLATASVFLRALLPALQGRQRTAVEGRIASLDREFAASQSRLRTLHRNA